MIGGWSLHAYFRFIACLYNLITQCFIWIWRLFNNHCLLALLTLLQIFDIHTLLRRLRFEDSLGLSREGDLLFSNSKIALLNHLSNHIILHLNLENGVCCQINRSYLFRLLFSFYLFNTHYSFGEWLISFYSLFWLNIDLRHKKIILQK